MVPRQQQKHSVENIVITRDSSVENTMIFENSRAVSQTEAGEHFLYHQATKTIQERDTF